MSVGKLRRHNTGNVGFRLRLPQTRQRLPNLSQSLGRHLHSANAPGRLWQPTSAISA